MNMQAIDAGVTASRWGATELTGDTDHGHPPWLRTVSERRRANQQDDDTEGGDDDALGPDDAGEVADEAREAGDGDNEDRRVDASSPRLPQRSGARVVAIHRP
jgi:hypothetical protein